MITIMKTNSDLSTAISHPTQARPAADAILRDAAFVMAMTRRVKEEMLNDQLLMKLARR